MAGDRAALELLSMLRGALTIGVYNFVFLLWFIAYAPILASRMLDPRYRRGFAERMGLLPRSRSDSPVIWIHGVSVGEVKAAGSLIASLRRRYAHCELVLSATTPTGHALARQLHPDLRVIYYPLDFGPFPAWSLDRVRPAVVLLVELELWPNFLLAAARRGVPVAVINGRISEKSFRGYRRVRGFLPQFNLIQRFCVQDEAYARRLLDLRVDPARISVTGNLKYDGVKLKDPRSAGDLRRWLSPDGRLVLTCGSTHADEEVRLIEAARRVASRTGQTVRIVVAPRHPERAAAVRTAIEALGVACAPWSRQLAQPRPLGDTDVALVDTIGHLEGFYGASDVAFVGGSLIPRGGQNMLEPAALGKPVVFGPHVFNFRTDVELLLGSEAALQVRDVADLERTLERLFVDVDLRRSLGERAVELIVRNQGATERTPALLEPLLAGTCPLPRADSAVSPEAQPRAAP
jgi:3-deoxy-D-manno-octulosonic-acid transferase